MPKMKPSRKVALLYGVCQAKCNHSHEKRQGFDLENIDFH